MKNKTPQPTFVYMVRCSDNSLYTGITRDLTQRVFAHNYTNNGAKYTRSRRLVYLVYSETQPSRSRALKRECEIKKLTREQKEALVTTWGPRLV